MTTYDFSWGVIWRYRDELLGALLLSLELAGLSMAIGGALGLALAYLAISRRRLLSLGAAIYVDVVRNTPLLLFTFVAFLVMPQLGLVGLDAKPTFVLALSIVASGYVCENLRAAFMSIPKAYVEGAKALGLRGLQRQRDVVLPIALRYALPALTNSAVSIFKDTSIASIIAVRELTFTAREISTNYFRVFEAWLTIGAIYLVVTALMVFLSRALERRLAGAS